MMCAVCISRPQFACLVCAAWLVVFAVWDSVELRPAEPLVVNWKWTGLLTPARGLRGRCIYFVELQIAFIYVREHGLKTPLCTVGRSANMRIALVIHALSVWIMSPSGLEVMNSLFSCGELGVTAGTPFLFVLLIASRNLAQPVCPSRPVYEKVLQISCNHCTLYPSVSFDWIQLPICGMVVPVVVVEDLQSFSCSVVSSTELQVESPPTGMVVSFVGSSHFILYRCHNHKCHVATSELCEVPGGLS